jgi:hypothetical protein
MLWYGSINCLLYPSSEKRKVAYMPISRIHWYNPQKRIDGYNDINVKHADINSWYGISRPSFECDL